MRTSARLGRGPNKGAGKFHLHWEEGLSFLFARRSLSLFLSIRVRKKKKKKKAMAGAQEPPRKPAPLGRTTPSFRLRNSGLNTIRLRRIFDLFDRNGDGVITVGELGQALGRLGLEADAEEVRSTVSAFTKPGHAGLEFEDFEVLHRTLGDALFGDLGGGGDSEVAEAEVDEDLAEAFSVFDEDGDGFISARELQTVLRKLGLAEGGDMARVHEMICAVDDNHDGQVDFSEFKHMMRGIAATAA